MSPRHRAIRASTGVWWSVLAALLLCLALLAPAGPASAQDTGGASDTGVETAEGDTATPDENIDGPEASVDEVVIEGVDYAAWRRTAERAENLIDAGGASTAFFENLRERLAEWRERLNAAQDVNAERIATIEGQIEALGALPEDGSDEPAPIAERREDLEAELAEAQLPGLNATEALIRVEGLIREVDALLSERQRRELLQRDPAPISPAHWPEAIGDLIETYQSISAEVRERLGTRERSELLGPNPALTVGLLLFGVYALWRGRHWAGRLTEALQARAQRRGGATVAFIGSLSQIAVPLVGLLAIVAAIWNSALLGPNAERLLEATAGLVLSAVTGYWLGKRLFPTGPAPLTILDLPDDVRRKARGIFLRSGALVGLGSVLLTVSELSEVSPASRAVITLPLFVLLSITYVRLARIIANARADKATEDASTFARGIMALLEKALWSVALLGPALALVGYTNAAQALMVPTVLTLGILGVLAALQPVVRDLHALIFKTTQEAAHDSLFPVIVNAVLIFAAIPLIALAWGVRPQVLGEIYAQFWLGFSVAGIEITPGTVVAIIFVFAAGMILTRLVQSALRSTVLPRTKLDTGARNAVTSGVGYVGVALAAVIAITAGGIDLTALGFVLGALSVGIGFGLQNVVSNFVSGIILLIERPISEGDWIEVNGNMGIVQAISVRSTRIETFDKTDVIVPNADFISGTVTNWTRSNSVGRIIMTVGVAYGTDSRKVIEILTDIAKGHPDIASFPEPGIDFLGFGADSLDFRIRAILPDIGNGLAVKNELYHQIYERFTEERIEIPFKQSDVWLRNPETLVDTVLNKAAQDNKTDGSKPDGATSTGDAGARQIPDDADGADGTEGNPMGTS